ncbi:MAG: formylglycine-generating enzyme family protein [Proteobacteria bacterium]|nr:MAG: formylglycine-generating enzyme family protein [Pseudomonadota bacterium]
MRWWATSIGCVVVLLSTPVMSASVPVVDSGYDVVVLKNGEIYNGAVASPRFDLRTPYGEISVPYGLMRSLDFTALGDVLTTQDGERFTGTLLQDELQVLRALDPTLPVERDAIASISFVKRRTRPQPVLVPDQIWLRNGDRMLAALLTQDLLVKTEDGLTMVNRSDAHIVDLEPMPASDEQRVMIRLNSPGEVVRGELLTRQIMMKTNFGSTAEIAADSIATIAVTVNRGSVPGATFPEPLFFRQVPSLAELRDRLRRGGMGPELVLLRGGRYTRGDATGDTDERPPKVVRLKPFAIGLYEVTFDEYDRYCEITGCAKPNDQGWGRGLRPVVNVSWEDAKRYTRWLSEQTGKRYRLPTDAEWEYAARAGSSSRFWWGDDARSAQANCEGCGSIWDGEKTTTVGKFPPNRFGLHDTAGNVWEWVEDCYHDSFVQAPDDGSAIDKPGCGKRVIRGGAWSFPAQEMRSANRWRDFPSRQSDDTGFRVVRELDP